MKRFLKVCKKRIIALSVCICLIVSMFGISVSAKDSSAPVQQEFFVSSLLKSTRTVCLNKLVGWALDGFMNAMFEPEDSQEVKLLKDIQEQMSTVLANQQKISDELKSLEGLVEVQSYLEIINDYMEALTLCEPFFQCYDTLNNIDKEYAGQPDALKIQRLRALTEGIGISNIKSANTSVDDKFLTLYSKFAGPISYSVNKQIISDGDLFDVYREIKRYQYCFENEAWDDMENFFEYAAYSFALVSLIETASVQARIESCRIHNEGKAVTDFDYYSTASLETWLYNDGGTAAESDLESRIKRGNDVYEEHTVVRHNLYRHFWKPGYEVLLYTKINSLGNHPVDEPLAGKGGTSAGTNFSKTAGMRIKREGEKAQPVESFWNKFYDSDIYPEAGLLTTEVVNKMLTACGHNSTLADILKAGDFEYENCKNIDECIGLVLRKNDTANPLKIDESHQSTWVEYLGTVYTDKIRVYTKYAPLSQMNDIGNGKASNYKTYYYYHTSDGSTRWYVNDEYTSGSLAQLYVCDDTCMHNHVRWVEDSAVVATCNKEGKERDWECLDCGKVFVGAGIPKLAHTGGKWQHTSSKHWKICEVCGEEYDAGPHTTASSSTLITGIYICDECGYITTISPMMLGWQIKDKDDENKETSKNVNSDEQKSPKTADSSNVAVYTLFSSLALAGVAVCRLRSKKKKSTVK